MKSTEINELWGEKLLNVFGNNIDADGWLTADWASIIEKEVDKDDKSEFYNAMYLLEFEYKDNDSFIRPNPN